MLPFVICFLAGANPDIWLPDSEFDKKYCRGRLITLTVTQTQLNSLYEAMARNPNLANDERAIAATQANFNLLQRHSKELEEERAEQKLRLFFQRSNTSKGRDRRDSV
jgi:hypothetical protein